MKRKSKEQKEVEDDLLFYLEYYKKFDSGYQKKIADKEIKDIEDKLKKSNNHPGQ